MSVTGSKILVFDRRMKEERDYWVARLSGETNLSNLRLDYSRSGSYSGDIDTVEVSLPKEVCRKLTELTGGGSFLLYTTLMAALKICLRMHTGSTSIVVGSPAFRQNDSPYQSDNVLAIVDYVDDKLSFRQLLLDVRQTLSDAYARQHYPFDRLVRDLGLQGIENKCPLFDVALVLKDIHCYMPEVKNDITITLAKEPDRISGRVVFNKSIFKRGSIECFTRHFVNVLQAGLENTNALISELRMLTEAERYQLLVEWNDTRMEYPKDTCIHELFEIQVERAADAVAIVFEDQHLTYRELNARASQLAHHLQGLGVGPEVLVGLCVERSVEMVVGILGTLKAGGAYVPLDPVYPKDRLAFMLQDAQVSVLLTQRRLVTGVPKLGTRVVCLDTDREVIARTSEENPSSGVMAGNLAYIIYTSGSTGKPKGVLIEHRGLCNMSEMQIRTFGLESKDRVFQFSSLSFDASAFEIFMALRVGATLCLGTLENLLPGLPLLRLLQDSGVTIVTLTPSTLAALPAEKLPTLRIINVAGEACPAGLVSRWAENRRFFNLYGPTEGTIWTTAAQCVDDGQKPSIGRPIANTQIYILDAHQQPVAVGVPGELCIGGVGLARGYLNQAERTAEAFIPKSFPPSIPPIGGEERGGARLYRTGDLARYLPDGNIEFLGRVDRQVKVRGFRIELGEIEAVLAQYPVVQDTVVMVWEDGAGDKRLVAYVVATPGLWAQGPKADGQEPAVSELRRFLGEKIPEYMVPSAFVTLEALPLTPNGKVDRRALPPPDQTRPELGIAFVAPRTQTEEVLAGIWTQILDIERVGIHDNFFELGGHSLLATQAISRLRDVFQVELPLRCLFETPTVAGLAQAIDDAQAEPSAGGTTAAFEVFEEGREEGRL